MKSTSGCTFLFVFMYLDVQRSGIFGIRSTGWLSIALLWCLGLRVVYDTFWGASVYR
jgi:hypothetical protein